MPYPIGVTGVQIVEICIATRSENGGLINLEELRTRLCKRRRCSHESLSEDDCFRAISKLKVQYQVLVPCQSWSILI